MASDSAREVRVVRAELLAQGTGDLADRAPRGERLPHGDEKVAGSLCGLGHRGEGGRGPVGIALVAHADRSLDLPPLRLRVEAVELDLLLVGLLVAVDADHDTLAGLEQALVLERGVLDLALHEA